MKNWTKLVAMVYGLLGIASDNAVPLEFTDAQKKKLDGATKMEGFAEKFMATHNEKLTNSAELEKVSEVAKEFMEATTPNGDDGAGDGTPNALVEAEDIPVSETIKAMSVQLKAERQAREKLEANMQKLKGLPEADNPQIIDGNVKTLTMKHSKTHLFASQASWDAFEDRPWNKAAAGLVTAATNWTGVNIDKLNQDIQDYFRKDPKTMMSTLMDGLVIPKYWKVISGVSDEYIFTTVTTGTITQGLKLKWLPKNKTKFDAQKGKVRDIQIDIEFNGNELKKLEKSYLNNFFNEGSTPHKYSFVRFVVAEMMKQARKEDKICIGKGVYYPNTDAQVPGSFLNNFSGVIKLALEARDVLYKSFNLGAPTEANIFDYIKSFAEGLPHDVKILPHLVLYVSPSWTRAYNEARRRVKGRDQDFDGKIMHVDGFANIELYPYDQLEGTDFMFLTTPDNIKILTDKPGEDGVLKFQEEGRNIKAFGDYKLASFIAMFGRKLLGFTSLSYDNQLFFSNDVEVLTDVYVPVPANDATPSLKYHNSLIIGENNTAATDITNFIDAPINTKVYVLGNADANVSTVKNNANISLLGGADCVLTNNQLLVLYVKPNGKFQELYRETLGVAESVTINVIDPDATTIDASLGTNFITSANTAATAIVGITNAVNGETYRIEGGSNTNASTIANAGNFVLSAAMTLTAGTFIELYYNGTKFIETNRG